MLGGKFPSSNRNQVICRTGFEESPRSALPHNGQNNRLSGAGFAEQLMNLPLRVQVGKHDYRCPKVSDVGR